MTNWMFIVTGRKYDGETFPADQIFGIRFEDKFWGLGAKTPNRKNLKKGDRVVFYMGLPHKNFVGAATLASGSYELSRSEREKFSHNKDFYRSDFGVLLEDTTVWERATPVESLVPDLEFIDNKEYWYAYFQGGVRELSDQDFNLVLESRKTSFSETVRSEEDIESESEFALESQLEEFLDTNWGQIDFGRSLVRIDADEQTGRQFPAGTWSIDFLCLDKDTDDLVVVELKRGKTSDATVGQVLRYMGWVRENIANRKQGVRGIIIAREVDKALTYAVSGQDKIEVLTYKLDFLLESHILGNDK